MTKARDLSKLVSQGQPLADGVINAVDIQGLAAVASSGSYNDLLDKPTSTPGSFSGNYADLTNKPTFAAVATSGSYSDLTNKPTLFSGSYADLTNKPTLFSGSYADLTNKPTLFDGSYNTLTDRPTLFSGSYADLTNKPTLFSGSYADLTNKPTLFSGSYTDLTNKPNFATVATSGSYADLTNKPTIISLKGTSITYPGDDLAANPAGGQTLTVIGTGFEPTPTVYVGGVIASSVTFVSSTQITFTAPARAAGTYDVYIVNPGGATAIMVMGISYSGVPAWSTAAGSLGIVSGTFSTQLQATSNSAVTYALASGSTLPSGITLSSGGLLSGTTNVEQTFSFTVVAIDAENQDTPRSFQVTVVISEEYFPYTTLLLTGNGTNGAQNNTFIDTSGNNRTTTRNGNVPQGTFSPYGPNWSNYFNGSSSLSIPANNAFNFGTGDFTIEFWAYLSPYVTNTGQASYWAQVIGIGTGSTNDANNLTNTVGIYQGDGTGSSTVAGEYTVIISGAVANQQRLHSGISGYNRWSHVALTRSSGVFRLYQDGVLRNSATVTADISRNDSQIIGKSSNSSIAGFISNLRVVKGTALYTSNFTPSKTPLPVVSGTSLLTCADNRLIDDSTNNFTTTATGEVSVHRFSPFNPLAEYSSAIYGGSAYFDGTGDFLSIPSGVSIGTSDFTLEAWVYVTSYATQWQSIISTRASNNTGGQTDVWALGVNSSGWPYIYSGAFQIQGSTGQIPQSTWTHLCVTRSGSTMRLYVNGVNVQTSTSNENYAVNAAAIGANRNGDEAFNGYIGNLRLVVGSVVYTSSFTPPTAPLTAVTNTNLLLNFGNASIIDNTMQNNLETVGTAQINTSVVKYGTGSMSFSSGNYVTLLNRRPAFINGTEDFTIEGWIYPTTIGVFNCIYSSGPAFQIYVTNANTVAFWCATNNSGSYDIVADLRGPISAVALNTWSHFAVVRTGSTFRVYVNGILGSTASSAGAIATPPNGSFSAVGTYPDTPNLYPFTGFIDDLRITKGYARYTTSFINPVAVTGTSSSGFSPQVTNAPYGVADNNTDTGWILSSGEFFTYDFGAVVSNIGSISFYSSFASGSRDRVLQIQVSNDGTNFTNLTTVNYSTIGAGVYAYDLPAFSARYVRVLPTGTGSSHTPRTATVKFSTKFTPPTSAHKLR